MTWYSRELDLGKSKTKKQNKVRKNSADAFGKNAEAKKEIRRAVLFLSDCRQSWCWDLFPAPFLII